MDSRPPWQLATPGDDGQFLLWPDADQWLDLARRTHESLARQRDVRLLDVPLADARRLAREQFPSRSPSASSNAGPDALWFLTGHQTFPYHAGIWAKSVAADAAARAALAAGAPAVAVNLNVDHDLPHAGPQITWPAVDDAGRLVRHGNLSLDHRQPFERQPAPTQQQLEALVDRISSDLSSISPESSDADRLRSDAGPQAQPSRREDFASWFTGLRAQLDARSGLDLREAMTSDLARQDGFLLLAADVIARAGSVFAIYNRALEATAETTGRSPARPLEMSASRLELPFWTLRPDRPGRGRLFASDGQTVMLSDSFGAIGAIPRAELRSADRALPALRRVCGDVGVELRPRALTLTLFARLLLADLFVHGLGGGVYDHATGMVIEQHFALRAPPFAIATATLRLPTKARTASLEAVRRSRQRARDLRFNPQRHLPPGERGLEPASSLVAAKWSAVERSAALRGVAGPDGDSRRRQRAELFRRIRQINRDLAGLIDDQLAAELALAAQLGHLAGDAEVAAARDYFYGLLPNAKLNGLRQSIISVFGGSRTTVDDFRGHWSSA